MYIRIATRKSALALWQAEEVSRRLRKIHDGLSVELIKITTSGDRLLQESLATQGGKGLFVKELQRSLLEYKADIAVHSMKDVPVELPSDLHVPVTLKRDDPRDAFISNRYDTLASLPDHAIVGTASTRRACQIKAAYPHLQIKLLRGNVDTRLAKLDDDKYDAIVLAVAGLERLLLGHRIRCRLTAEASLPAIGQGVIGIECRRNDKTIETLVQPLHHADTHVCVTAERTVSQTLQGGCQLPIAGFAELNDTRLRLRALVGHPDGHGICRSERYDSKEDPVQLGRRVAEDLLTQGADKILATSAQ